MNYNVEQLIELLIKKLNEQLIRLYDYKSTKSDG